MGCAQKKMMQDCRDMHYYHKRVWDDRKASNTAKYDGMVCPYRDFLLEKNDLGRGRGDLV